MTLAMWLLEHGADPCQEHPSTKDSLVHIAAKFGHASLLGLLLRSGSNPLHLNRAKRTPIMSAALGAVELASSHGSIDCIKQLAKAGVDIHAADLSGLTALHHASLSRPLMRYLLTQGARINQPDCMGHTVLTRVVCSTASENANPKLLRWLMEQGAHIHHAPRDGSTAVHMAIAARKFPTLLFALELGVDLEFPPNPSLRVPSTQ